MKPLGLSRTEKQKNLSHRIIDLINEEKDGFSMRELEEVFADVESLFCEVKITLPVRHN